MNDSVKQELLEETINSFIKKRGLKPENIIVRTREVEGEGRLTGAEEILCSICYGVIASAIWDGIKWVWENYDHICPGAPSPAPQEPSHPSTCPMCHEQLVPGKVHYCK